MIKALEARVRKLEEAKGLRAQMVDVLIERFAESGRPTGELCANGTWLERRPSETDEDYCERAFADVCPWNGVRVVLVNAFGFPNRRGAT